MEGLSQEEKDEVLARLRERHPQWRKEAIVRYLVGHGYQEEVAEKAMTDAEAFRGQYGALEPLRSDNAQLRAENCMGRAFVIGRSRSGNPLFILTPRLHEPSKSGHEDLVRLMLYYCDHILDHYALDRARPRYDMLVDCGGVGLGNRDLASFRAAVVVLQTVFPETLGQAYVINMGWVFRTIWMFASPFLSESTHGRIHMVKHLPDLLEYIDADVLPVAFGGANPYVFAPTPDVMDLGYIDGKPIRLTDHLVASINFLDSSMECSKDVEEQEEEQAEGDEGEDEKESGKESRTKKSSKKKEKKKKAEKA